MNKCFSDFVKSFLKVAFVFAGLFVFTTCSDNVGLGAKVDTEAPSLGIGYPLPSDVVNGTITLSGVWDDDKAVSSINISVFRSDSTDPVKTAKADIHDDKTWSFEMNKPDENGNFELTDGTYTINIIAKDAAGHSSGEASRTFDIDNTPPVFALTSPNSVNADDPTNYGTVFTIEGEVADDHAIKSMKAWIYDTEGNLKTEAPLKFSSIETTGGTSVVVAQYQSTDSVLDSNYQAMYDLQHPGTTQRFYAVIVLEDEAGNVSSSSYIKSSVIDALESELGIDSTNSVGLKSSDIKKIINGTFKSSDTSATKPNVSLETLRNIVTANEISPFIAEEDSSRAAATPEIEPAPKFDSSKKYLAFSLNSNANPTYEIVGYSYNPEETETIEETGSGTSLNIKVQSGLNGYKVRPEVKVNVWAAAFDGEKYSKSGIHPYAIIEGSKRTVFNTETGAVVSSENEGAFITNSNGVAVDTLSTTVDTATYTFKLPKLSARKVYILEAAGSDVKDQPIEGTSEFAFRVSASGKPVSAVFGDTDNSKYENIAALSVTQFFDKLCFSGTLKTDTAIATRSNPNAGEYSKWMVKATREDGPSKEIAWEGEINFDGDGLFSDDVAGTDVYGWSVPSIENDSDEYKSIKEELKNGACYLFEVSVIFVNGSETTKELTRSVHIDTKKPVVAITSVTPLVANPADKDKPKLNGTLKLSGAITETNMKELHYYVNLTEAAIENVKNKTGIELKNPVWDNDAAYAANPEFNKIHNPLSTNLNINLDISTKNLIEGILRNKGFSEDSSPTTLAQAQALFDSIESEIEFGAYAVDQAGNRSEDEKRTYVFAQMTDTPVIQLTNAEAGEIDPTSTKNMFGTKSNRNLIGTVTDDDGLKSVTIKYRKWGSEEDFKDGNFEFSENTTSASINFELPEAEGEYEYVIFAEDNKEGETNYNKDTKTFHVAVDAGDPVLMIETSQNMEVAQNTSFTISGTVKDGASVEVYRYSIKTNEKENPVGIGAATKLALTPAPDGSYTWADSILTGSNGDTVTYRAVDKYGYHSDASLIYSVDSIKPEISITSLKNGDDIFETNSNYKASSEYALNGSELSAGAAAHSGNFLTVIGSWSDTKKASENTVDGSGTAKLEYSLNKTDWITVLGTSSAFMTPAIWRFDLPITVEGPMNLYVRATDAAGNDSVVAEVTGLKADFAKPVLTIPTISSTDSVRKSTESATNGYYYVKSGETLTIEGVYSDSYEMESVTPEFKLNGNVIHFDDYADYGISFNDIVAEDKKSGNYTVKVTGNNSNNGSLTFGLKAKDASGRESEIPVIGMVVDTVAPVFSDENSSIGNTKNSPVKTMETVNSTWFKNEALVVAGEISDSTSGIAEIQYTFTPSGSSTPLTDSLTVSNIGEGKFTYNSTISGFVAGDSNVLVLTVVDRAGNTATALNYNIKVDGTNPEIELYGGTDSILTNGTADLDVKVKVSDDASGVDSVVIKIGKENTAPSVVAEKTEDITTAEGIKTGEVWKATLTHTEFASLVPGSTNNILGVVADAAGNTYSTTVSKLEYDNIVPAARINLPVHDAVLNGKNSISGKVTETNPASFKLYYSLKDPTASDCTLNDEDFGSSGTKWIQIGSEITDPSAIINWEGFNFDFTENSDAKNAADGTDIVYILPVVTDTAGNCNIYTTETNGTKTYNLGDGTSEKPFLYTSYNVDLNADRPVIKFNEITGASGTLRKYTKSITGALSDDDGGIVEFKIYATTDSADAEVPVSVDKWNTYTQPAGTLDWSEGNTSFTFEPKIEDDGEIFVYFYIKDAAGGVFFTKNAATLNRPYVWYKGSDNKTNNETKINYRTDSKTPVIVDTKASDSGKNPDGTTASTVDNILMTSYTVGGNLKKKVQFTIQATDASGIDGIAADLYYTTSNAGIETHYVSRQVSKEGLAAGDAYSVTGTFTENGVTATWITAEIDISTVPSGSITLNLTPYDKAGLTGNQSYTFTVDNIGPEIMIASPENAASVTGDVTISGSAIDSGAGTEEIFWMVPTKEEILTATGKGTEKERFEYLKGLTWNGGKDKLVEEKSVSSWAFKLDGNANPKLTGYDNATYAQNEDYATTSVYKLPIYFMAVDMLGNYRIYESYYLNHDPEGDRPVLKFTYPTASNYDENKSYLTIGGTIRATGTALIPSGTTNVKSVYIQIADSAAGFTDSDKSKASGNYGLAVLNAYHALADVLGESKTIANDEDAKLYGFKTKAAMDSWWGIKTSGSASWNIALNSDGKMNPEDSSTTNNITIRACGINAEGKFGIWTKDEDVIAIHIDDNAPTIASSINQYDVVLNSSNIVLNNAAIASSSSQNYDADMFLRGSWYLVLDILDESGVGELEVKKNKVTLADSSYLVASINDENDAAGIADSTTAKKGKKVFVPIGQDSGRVEFSVRAVDTGESGGHPAIQEFSFNIDNVAPTLENLKGNSEELSDGENSVQDKNYVYDIEGSSTDEGSGFERIAFYYMRKDGVTGTITNNVVMDPFITPGTDDAKISMNSLSELTVTQGDQSYKIYAKSVTGTVTEDSFTGTLDSHIRAGGLIYIDGLYRKISNIAGNKVTFEPSVPSRSPAIGSGKTVYFPISQVIDNTNSEIIDDIKSNPFTFKSGDDGDKMPETIAKAGKTWSWTASIHSTNLPDGPATLVILAFDKAGNVSGKTFNMVISNNAPKIAKVFLATDLNANNKFEEEEFEVYSIIGNAGSEKDAYTINFSTFGTEYSSSKVAGFTVKDKLAIVPEIVGGNGDISLVAKKNAQTTEPVTKENGMVIPAVASRKTSATNKTDLTAVGGSSYTISSASFNSEKVGNSFYGYVLNNSELSGITSFETNKGSDAGRTTNEAADGTGKAFSFTFWDKTEERTQGINTQKAVLLVEDFNFDLTDGTKPTVVVNPFYWNNISDNSIYDSKAAKKIADLAGHIELEADLNFTGTTFTEATGVMDKQPKVSGKIVFTGTAYDGHALGSISAVFSDILDGDIATYTARDSTWAVAEATMASEGYEVTVSDAGKTYSYDGSKQISVTSENSIYGNFADNAYFGQKGHKIYWTLAIDTAKLTSVTATDLQLVVKAKDIAENETSTTETEIQSQFNADRTVRSVTDGTTNDPLYGMDVVPYITKLYTGISDTAGEEFARSASGKYSVRAGETIKLYGFNIAAGTNNVSINGTNVTSTAGTGCLNVPVGTTATSGAVTIIVNGITSLNNSNKNPEFVSATDNTITAAEYNCQANGLTSDRFTDDIGLYIWDMGNFVNTTNITSPMLKIDSSSNWYMSYGYGVPSMYVNKNGTTRQVDYSFNKFHNTNVAFDESGAIYAVGTNTDRVDNGSARFVFYAPVNSDGYPNTANDAQYNYSTPGTSRIHLEQVYNSNTKVYDINRVRNPKITTYTSGSDAYIAMAYYDYNNTITPVKFRFGKKTGPTYTAGNEEIDFKYSNNGITVYSWAGTTTASGYRINGTDSLSDYGNKYVLINGKYYKLARTQYQTKRNGNQYAYYTLDGYTADFKSKIYTFNDGISFSGGIANGITTTYEYTAGESNDPATTDSSAKGYHIVSSKNTAKQGGAYAACGIVPDSTVAGGYVGVVAWYDASVRRICYSYNANPGTAVVGGVWQTNAKYLDGAYTGWYVDMKVDAAGGIHIAYYNSAKGDLKYVYLSKYDAEPTEPVTIDSYLSVGTNITVDARPENGKYVPYIYYYNSSANQTPSSIKVAWRSDMTTLRDGAVNDKFTGAWESMTIPTENIPSEATVCGGVPTSGTWGGSVVLGYMTDRYYERANLKK
ncbi:MAG: hypothetical protein KBT11_02705 [Treponema sp.]|nr:hypothetical protein [Candidatus Treponema equifaecale]